METAMNQWSAQIWNSQSAGGQSIVVKSNLRFDFEFHVRRVYLDQFLIFLIIIKIMLF